MEPLDKALAHSPQFLNLARVLLKISEEKADLAMDFKEYCERHGKKIETLNSRAAKAVEEFNLLYREAQLNCGDG